jgi:hypothetical protein
MFFILQASLRRQRRKVPGVITAVALGSAWQGRFVRSDLHIREIDGNSSPGTSAVVARGIHETLRLVLSVKHFLFA